MACGCATVLGRDGGVTEYARDGENTLLVDPADRDATVAAVVRLLDDRALRSRFVAAGLETAARFDCDTEALATSRLFATALAERGVALGEVG